MMFQHIITGYKTVAPKSTAECKPFIYLFIYLGIVTKQKHTAFHFNS